MAKNIGATPWIGMHLSGWLDALGTAGYQVDRRYIPHAALITALAAHNVFLRWLVDLRFGRRLEQVRIEKAPIFIIGHWRCGTTFLHELLGLDPEHTFPSVYECSAPNIFVWEIPKIKAAISRFLPTKRPFDNMAWSFDTHGEDEFALCNLGVPSPYINMAFPNGPLYYRDYLDLEGLSETEREAWKQALETFIRQITFLRQKRVVLKSPTHTFRVKTILELFPEAIFVHIVRNPYLVFSSTMHLWRTCCDIYSLQEPHLDGLEECVFDTFNQLYARLDQTRGLIPPERYHELRYEDLVSDPVGAMHELYDALSLGDFDRAAPAIESHLRRLGDYRTNVYTLSEELEAKICDRWGEVIDRYGYTRPERKR
jgi:hypothetical protein